VLLAAAVAGTTARAEADEPTPPEVATEDERRPVLDFSEPMGPKDPFNRGTPRGSMYGYLSSARKKDFDRAAEFLDLRRLPPSDRARGPELARRLKAILDQTIWVDLVNLPDTNAGSRADGLPEWQQRLGEIQVADENVTLLMQRVPRAKDGVPIWKIAAVTVEQVDDLYAQLEPTWLEAWLPEIFFDVTWLEVALWKWAGLVLLLLGAWLAALLIAGTSMRLLGILFTRKHEVIDDRIVNLLGRPVTLAWAVLLFGMGRGFLGLSLSMVSTLRNIERLLLAVAAAWLVFRLIDLGAVVLRIRAERRGNQGIVPALVPGGRFAKMLVLLIGVLGVLGTLGVDVTAAVAGLGVGGIAVALAAQKTIENLFGGVTLFADRPVQVGEFFRYGTEMGTVEEIGLRSTRVRTRDRTVVTIPNAEFSNLRLENFDKRDRMRLRTIIGVRYETTSDQLRYLLTRMREVLIAHPRALPKDQRVRFVGFGAYSLDIEVIAFVDTESWTEFLAVQEDIYLLLMDVVKEAGSGFAFPSTTTYVGRDDGLCAEAAREAESRVREWREEGRLPFPSVPEDHYQAIENSLDWPPRGAPPEAEPK
jgi:MscS family membrane protein